MTFPLCDILFLAGLLLGLGVGFMWGTWIDGRRRWKTRYWYQPTDNDFGHPPPDPESETRE